MILFLFFKCLREFVWVFDMTTNMKLNYDNTNLSLFGAI